MDPRFGLARKLQEKARNPRADVDVDELRAALSSAVAAAPRRDTAEVAPVSPEPPPPPAARDTPDLNLTPSAEALPTESLDALSLDSLSLDSPASDLASPSGRAFESGFGSRIGDTPPPDATTEEQITLLLRQGDDARAGGDKQQAIEIWSRIFLIDIDNSEAVERIEETRRDMSEESRRVAAALEQGRESYARGDLDAAREQFGAVLNPDGRPARPLPPPPAAPPQPTPLPPHDLSAVTPAGDVLAEEMDQSGPPGRRSWTSSPRPRVDTAVVPPPEEPKRAGMRLNPRIAGIAAVVLMLAAGAAFFLTRGPAKTDVTRAESGLSLEHATALFREGKIAETMAELRQIPPSSPDYARAQKLLASLGPQPEEGAPAPGPGAPAASAPFSPSGARNAPARRADAERALNEKRYIDALKDFSLAEPAFRGDPTFAQEMAAASERVTELTPAVKLYNEGEYETAIPMLWRIYQAQRDNQDARSYLLRSYFNQGIAQLQNGLYDKAKESFGEAIALDPQDAEAVRHRQFAERYRSGDLDLLGRIYVRYISPRP
jgi:tetratricopeptide (TPR) repeat protein